MPPYIRRDRGWDYRGPVEIRHLRLAERERLLKLVQDRLSLKNDWLPLPPALLVRLCLFGSGTALLIMLATISESANPLVRLALFLELAVIVFSTIIVIRYWFLYRNELRHLLIAENICPALCFDCGGYTEGFEGAECPECGARLVNEKAGAE
jgi:hypothetical protein